MATRPKKSSPVTVVAKPDGRGTTFTQRIGDEIADRIASGEPLAAICRDDHMPGLRTVYDWMEASASFAAQIARAREAGYDMIAQEALNIADTPVEALTERSTAAGLEITRQDALGHRKLQIETRLKLLAKWDPKRYGDKLAIGGAADLPALQAEVNITLDPSEAYKRMLGQS